MTIKGEKLIAEQLRKPNGKYAIQVGREMNKGNLNINLNTIKSLHLSKNDTILEIGMGNGHFVKDILGANSSIDYTGCDYSEIMVQEASKNNKVFIEKGVAHFYLANINKLPFDDETFNKVFSINTIYFWDDIQGALSEISRVLKSKGQITISLRPQSIMKHYPFVKYGFNTFTKNNLVNLLLENNFNLIDIIEKDEPLQEINGKKIKVETLIVCAEKKKILM